ncbi:MAG: dihydropteroate synthase [Bacteroidota bacterium]
MKPVMDTPMILQCKERVLDLSRRTAIMGIVNVTPDSFSDGGDNLDPDAALHHARMMVEDGADIIDVGGESTRPKGMYGDGAKKISVQEELDRVIPVIERISRAIDTIISIDTYKSEVAQEALNAGASMVNDISGLRFDGRIARVAAQHRAALVVMHIQGTPETMQQHPVYQDVVREVREELRQAADKAHAEGVRCIVIDPGIGFGKNLEHNLSLIKHLDSFRELGYPILIGTSRKGFIGAVLDLPVDQRIEGTAATVAISIMNGAHIVRVHDVREMKRVAVVTDAIMKNA